MVRAWGVQVDSMQVLLGQEVGPREPWRPVVRGGSSQPVVVSGCWQHGHGSPCHAMALGACPGGHQLLPRDTI